MPRKLLDNFGSQGKFGFLRMYYHAGGSNRRFCGRFRARVPSRPNPGRPCWRQSPKGLAEKASPQAAGAFAPLTFLTNSLTPPLIRSLPVARALREFRPFWGCP